ncbi:L-aspartate oxidase [Brachybacterium sacelli]|uniref:L-aspartate oxidase n=1 Tax=Brachybacterium sacelli TaxID=173364 RepID=A0ABS4WYB3_9MICO|nr:L-aspartate oxidase [Brachybacterium sacelli]MBP2381194.1 L-aspartate oxidase [Brachybacterium sacelli]
MTADLRPDLHTDLHPDLRTDLLVIGSGIAGLTAALHASQNMDVLLVTKSEAGEGSTRYAQGGIAGALDRDDSPAAHARDTLVAGAGLCDEDAVRVLCEEGPGAIRELIDRGVDFDRVRGPGSPYALCLEGAHHRPRILHAGGDATGVAIEQALLAAVHGSGVVVREHTALVDLHLEGGDVVGAELMTTGGGRLRVRAAATLLATGGAGQLFSHTTNPAVATGDGVAAAWRAGAAVEDLEFYQFHPTALAIPGAYSSFLVSEAVRGEGATLRDEHGARLMQGIDPRADLAPRDIVSRTIAQVMAAQDGRPVRLDATGIAGDRLRERFPTIDAAVRAAGIDWGHEPVPVTPAAHYWMGGIRTDLDGRTTLPGLFAAGECARTGVHGANRLASNSLLEGAVFGARAGAAAVEEARRRDPSAGRHISSGAPRTAAASPGDAVRRAPRATAVPSPASWTRTQLQELMWARVGPLRTREQLDTAAAQLATWTAPDPATATTIGELENRNLLDLARLVATHALARPASVGAHHRLDPIPEVLAC